MRDARVLAADVAGVAPGRMTLLAPEEASADALRRFDDHVAARAGGLPVARVIGRAAFWGRDFAVDAHVLVPRPETETLIAAALDADWRTLVDLGTGSGCIAVTLLAERPAASGHAVDLSAAALAVAARNAAAHGVAARFTSAASDWWAAVDGRFDLIASNPPYVAAGEMAGLSREVLAEPRLALTPGGDGLDAYRAIAPGVADHLSPGGTCLLEIGPSQAAAVSDLLRDAGARHVDVLRDMDGRDRVVRGRGF